MKRLIPLVITFLAGFLMIVSSFVPKTESWKEDIVIWFDILAAIAFLLGGGNLLLNHLRKISDRRAGWGYSAVTLIAFLGTLTVGLLKVGVAPAPQTEKYGEVAVSLPVSAFPVSVTVDAAVPPEPFPASVNDQMTANPERSSVTFRGWMSPGQKSALESFEMDARWHATVERLHSAAQPPEPVRGRVFYTAYLEELSFAGVLSDQQQQSLRELSQDAAWTSAVDALAELSRRTHAIPLEALPEGVAIPESLKDRVTFDAAARQLAVQGPLSSQERDALAKQFPKGEPLTEAERESLENELAALGPLSEAQRGVIGNFNDSAASVGERNLALMYRLVRPSAEMQDPQLTDAQRDRLIRDYNREVVWTAKVYELYEAAHQKKYPWSGSYDQEGSAFWYVFEYGIQPLQSTMFALLGFFVASAAFRAFRAKNVEATLLLGTAFLILLGATYAGTVLTSWIPERFAWLTIPELKVTIMSVFATAGTRAIMIGIALGIVSTSLKILLGVDRSYLGSDSE